MAQAESRSPSPAPIPPTAAAPGPRALKLIQLYNDAITHTLKTCDYQNFATCFPTTAKNQAESLQGFHQEFITHLGDQCRLVFDSILESRHVVQSLNDLDRLVEDGRKRRQKAQDERTRSSHEQIKATEPPHTLSPQRLYLARLSPTIQATKLELETELAKTQKENAQMVNKIQAQRCEIERIIGSVEAVVADLDGSLQALPAQQMQAYTHLTVDLDEELRDVQKND